MFNVQDILSRSISVAVYLFDTPIYCIEMTEHVLILSLSVSSVVLVVPRQILCGNSSLQAALNTCGVWLCSLTNIWLYFRSSTRYAYRTVNSKSYLIYSTVLSVTLSDLERSFQLLEIFPWPVCSIIQRTSPTEQITVHYCIALLLEIADVWD